MGLTTLLLYQPSNPTKISCAQKLIAMAELCLFRSPQKPTRPLQKSPRCFVVKCPLIIAATATSLLKKYQGTDAGVVLAQHINDRTSFIMAHMDAWDFRKRAKAIVRNLPSFRRLQRQSRHPRALEIQFRHALKIEGIGEMQKKMVRFVAVLEEYIHRVKPLDLTNAMKAEIKDPRSPILRSVGEEALRAQLEDYIQKTDDLCHTAMTQGWGDTREVMAMIKSGERAARKCRKGAEFEKLLSCRNAVPRREIRRVTIRCRIMYRCSQQPMSHRTLQTLRSTSDIDLA